MTEVESTSYLIKESYNRSKKTDCTEMSNGTCLVFEFMFYLSLLLYSLNPQIFFSILVIFSVPAFFLGVSNVSCEPGQWRQTLLLGVWWCNCQPLQLPVQILYELQLSTHTHGHTHTHTEHHPQLCAGPSEDCEPGGKSHSFDSSFFFGSPGSLHPPVWLTPWLSGFGNEATKYWDDIMANKYSKAFPWCWCMRE